MKLDSRDNQLYETPTGLTPREAYTYLQNRGAIVDIRPVYETNYRVFDVQVVYVLSYGEYKVNYKEIPREKPLLIADSVGLKSPEVAQFLLNKGYLKVAYLAGGIIEWERQGFPIEKDLGYALQGACACMLKPKKLVSQENS